MQDLSFQDMYSNILYFPFPESVSPADSASLNISNFLKTGIIKMEINIIFNY